MLASAAAYRTLKRASDFGLSAEGVGFDFGKIIDRKDRVVSQIAGPGTRRYLESLGLEVLEGAAFFISQGEADVGGRRVSFDKAVVATGSTPWAPPIEGLDETGYITSNEAINLRQLPESIIIVGGSAVGLEFATIYGSFGSRVTIVETAPRIAFKEDEDVSLLLHRAMTGRGVAIHTGSEVKRAFRDGGRVGLSVRTPDGETTVRADALMIATGRRPLLDGLNLEEIGVRTSRAGIEVDEFLKTSVDSIYAAGDVVPGFQLAQAAAYEGDLAGLNAIEGNVTEASYRVMPRCTWSYPEMASVGVTEAEAREQGLPHVTSTFALGGLGRAFADDERAGFVKAIADPMTGELLGFHAIGHRVDEILHEAVVAMSSRIDVAHLAQAIHCELTMAEGAGDVFIDLDEAIGRKKAAA